MIELNLSGARSGVNSQSYSGYDLGFGNYLRRVGGAAMVGAGVAGIPAVLYAGSRMTQNRDGDSSLSLAALATFTLLGLYALAKTGLEIIVRDIRDVKTLRLVNELRIEDLEELTREDHRVVP